MKRLNDNRWRVRFEQKYAEEPPVSEILKSLGFTGDDYRGLFDCLFVCFVFFSCQRQQFSFFSCDNICPSELESHWELRAVILLPWCNERRQKKRRKDEQKNP